VKASRLLALPLSALVLFTSCATTVNFQANAADAELSIDGEPQGRIPVRMEMSNLVFNPYEVELTAPGYLPYHGKVEKEVKALALVGGLFLYLVPWLWAYGPKANQYFELIAAGANTPGAAAPATVAAASNGRLSLAVLEFKIENSVGTAGLTGRDLALFMETYISAYDRFELQDRLYLSEVMAEKELQATDLFDPAFAASLGSLKGPGAVLIGQVRKIGDGLSVFVKVVNVNSGTQSRVFERSDIFIGSRGVNSLKDALKEIAADLDSYYASR